MPAYYRNLEQRCPAGGGLGCGKPATYKVFNTFNAEVGTYCRGHAEAKVAQLNREPAEQPRPPRYAR